MTELAACATATKPRPWLAPIAIVVAFALFNILLDPFGNREDSWFVSILVGGLFQQPVLLAMWAAFGPAPAIRRIPLSIAALAAILLAPAVAKQLSAKELSDTEVLVMVSGMFLVLSHYSLSLASSDAGASSLYRAMKAKPAKQAVSASSICWR
jgi:hypothetical protein